MKPQRWLASLSALGLLSCSFIDDFEKFRPAVDAGPRDDGGGADAGRDDATASEPDAMRAPGDAGGDGAQPESDAAVADCTGANNGTPCAGGICVFQACTASMCGDGYVDRARGEECDAPDALRGDGCEPVTCTFSCEQDGECDDDRTCNGAESCDRTLHRCVAGTSASAEGQSCTSNGVAGSCRTGLCIPSSCGNGTIDPGEACELGTSDCRADCQLGCRVDADCRNENVCDGAETCDATTRECRSGGALACSDGDACTLDGVCDPDSGCRFLRIDEDRDGFSPPTCAAGSNKPADCNDLNKNAWPGATEFCDGIDNDCDGDTDEGVLVQCFADRDGDRFPSRVEVSRACVCPAGTLPVADPARSGDWDCWDDPLDRGADVFPGQTAFFDEGYGPGGRRERNFDYDCDNMVTTQYLNLDSQGCTGLLGLLCAMKQGFLESTPCGETGDYAVCAMGALACEARESSRKQGCR